MMDNLDFSEAEIEAQLALLGYKNIPKHRLLEFKQDLDGLIQRGEWRSLMSPTPANITSHKTTSQPSAPAYIKEKVSCSEGFFLHAGKDQQELHSHQKRDGGRQQGCCDSYIQHSVAQRLKVPPGDPGRLQMEPDPERSLNSPLSGIYTCPPDPQERRFIKRKVLRKHEGQSLVCDESIHSEDSGAASCSLEERLDDLHLCLSAQQVEEADGPDHSESHTDSHTDCTSPSAFGSYMGGMTHTQSDGDLRPKPKSFIRPTMSQQSIKKSDPVAKYFQYKQIWDMFKCPGEADRRTLRWEIKERLAYQPPPPKPQRVYIPNTYTVPTEKKRSALRWEVRNHLANNLS